MFGKCSVEWMRMIRVAAAAPAPGSGRANSSAAIVIDVASSGTVRSTTYSKQKLEAAADKSYIQQQQLLRHCSGYSHH